LSRSSSSVHLLRLFLIYTVQRGRPQHVRTLTPINARTQILPYERLRRTESADLEIHEVSTGVSLSTKTSPTTESIAPLNPKINLEKYEHSYQVKNLNPTQVKRFHTWSLTNRSRSMNSHLLRLLASLSAAPRLCSIHSPGDGQTPKTAGRQTQVRVSTQDGDVIAADLPTNQIRLSAV
jgi:hypothetical protein